MIQNIYAGLCGSKNNKDTNSNANIIINFNTFNSLPNPFDTLPRNNPPVPNFATITTTANANTQTNTVEHLEAPHPRPNFLYNIHQVLEEPHFSENRATQTDEVVLENRATETNIEANIQEEIVNQAHLRYIPDFHSNQIFWLNVGSYLDLTSLVSAFSMINDVCYTIFRFLNYKLIKKWEIDDLSNQGIFLQNYPVIHRILNSRIRIDEFIETRQGKQNIKGFYFAIDLLPVRNRVFRFDLRKIKYNHNCKAPRYMENLHSLRGNLFVLCMRLFTFINDLLKNDDHCFMLAKNIQRPNFEPASLVELRNQFLYSVFQRFNELWQENAGCILNDICSNICFFQLKKLTFNIGKTSSDNCIYGYYFGQYSETSGTFLTRSILNELKNSGLYKNDPMLGFFQDKTNHDDDEPPSVY